MARAAEFRPSLVFLKFKDHVLHKTFLRAGGLRVKLKHDLYCTLIYLSCKCCRRAARRNDPISLISGSFLRNTRQRLFENASAKLQPTTKVSILFFSVWITALSDSIRHSPMFPLFFKISIVPLGLQLLGHSWDYTSTSSSLTSLYKGSQIVFTDMGLQPCVTFLRQLNFQIDYKGKRQ